MRKNCAGANTSRRVPKSWRSRERDRNRTSPAITTTPMAKLPTARSRLVTGRRGRRARWYRARPARSMSRMASLGRSSGMSVPRPSPGVGGIENGNTPQPMAGRHAVKATKPSPARPPIINRISARTPASLMATCGYPPSGGGCHWRFSRSEPRHRQRIQMFDSEHGVQPAGHQGLGRHHRDRHADLPVMRDEGDRQANVQQGGRQEDDGPHDAGHRAHQEEAGSGQPGGFVSGEGRQMTGAGEDGLGDWTEDGGKVLADPFRPDEVSD